MGWLNRLTDRAINRGIDGSDAADVATRANILATSLDDQLRPRPTSPPPVAGWRYEQGSWLRWSELDGTYRAAPIPISLTTYGRSLGTPREGLTVALVDGAWREVSDGAAPLRVPADAPGPDLQPPNAPAGWPPPPSGSAIPPPLPPADAGAVPPGLARQGPAETDAEPSMEDQLTAWRRRNRSPDH